MALQPSWPLFHKVFPLEEYPERKKEKDLEREVMRNRARARADAVRDDSCARLFLQGGYRF